MFLLIRLCGMLYSKNIMGKHEKLLIQILRGTSDENIPNEQI